MSPIGRPVKIYLGLCMSGRVLATSAEDIELAIGADLTFDKISLREQLLHKG